MTESKWYDKFARFYDVATVGDVFYNSPRKAAIEQLCLSSNDGVMDMFCGTGVDFDLIYKKIASNGHIFAVNGSMNMLNQARQRSGKLGLRQENISFIQTDLANIQGIESLCTLIEQEKPKAIIFSLGLTCLSNWRELSSEVFNAAAPETRLSIMDVYSKNLTIGARFINWIGSADCQRPVWQELEQKCQSFSWQEYRPFKVLDVSVIVASGIKPRVV